MVRKYLETFETLSKDIDTIVPEELTKPKEQNPAGDFGADPTGQLLQEVNGSDPQDFLDKLGTLPQNEKQQILQQIQQVLVNRHVSGSNTVPLTPGAPIAQPQQPIPSPTGP